MPYVLEKIDGEGRKWVDEVAGPALARIMDKRCFWESDGFQFDHSWAIDQESRNFLMRSPRFFLPLPGELYFFGFRSKIYRLHVKGSFDPLVNFYTEEKPLMEEYEEFKKELTRAFAVHGVFGISNLGYVPIVPVFLRESDRDAYLDIRATCASRHGRQGKCHRFGSF